MARKLAAVGIMIGMAVLFLFASVGAAETLTLGAGGGYKRMLEGALKLYEQKTGQKVNQVYGHMGQVMMQAKSSGTMGIIVGELSFLKLSGLEFAEFREIGQGVLVLAYGKGVKLESPEDLYRPEIQKIAMPDPKQAIYGKAALEFLQNSGNYGKLQTKIITVATIPQVSSYLISKDAEAGFINITDAIYIKEKIGGWVAVDKTKYSPVHLVIGVLKGFESKPEVKKFLDFMTTDREVREILEKAGIK